MTAPLLRLPLLAAALWLTLPAAAADPPPLPKGATARLGTPLLRDTSGWAGAALRPDGKHLVGRGPTGYTRFDVTTGEPAGTFGPKSPSGAGGYLVFTPDGKTGLSISYGTTTVWEAESGKPLAEVKRPAPYGDTAAALSADGAVLAVGFNKDFNVKDKPVTALVWDVAKNEKRAEVAVVQNQAANVALSPDGKVLATWGIHYDQNPPKDADPAADPNRVVQFWDAATGKELAKTSVDGFGAARVVFAPDGQTAAVTLGGGPVRLLDPKTGTEKRRLFGRGDPVVRVVFAPDGKTIAVAGTDGAVQLFGADGTRGALVECPVGPLSAGVREVVFTAPDRAVAWAAVGLTAVAWELPGGKLISPFGGHVSAVRSVAFADGGKEVRSGGDDGRVLRWDAAGKELGEVRLQGAGSFRTSSRFPMGTVLLTPDGQTAVGQVNAPGIYDAATGRQVSAPTGALGFNARPYLTADARTLLIVPTVPFPPKPRPKALTVEVWDVATGAKLPALETPVGEVTAAAVTPDRSKLVTAMTTARENGAQGEFLVTGWDLATGKKLGTLTAAAGYGIPYLAPAADSATALVVTSEGKKLAVDIAAGTAKEFAGGAVRVTAPPVFGPGGKQVALALAPDRLAGEATVRVYDWPSGQPAATFRGHAGPVGCVAFSPDGKMLASGGADTTVLLWDIAAGKE